MLFFNDLYRHLYLLVVSEHRMYGFLKYSLRCSPVRRSLPIRSDSGYGSLASGRKRSGRINRNLPSRIRFAAIPSVSRLLRGALANPPAVQPSIYQTIVRGSCIDGLLDLFHVTRSLRDHRALFQVFGVFGDLVLLGGPPVLQRLLLRGGLLFITNIFRCSPICPSAHPNFQRCLLSQDHFGRILRVSGRSL